MEAAEPTGTDLVDLDDEILDRAMVARIATVSRSGRPHVNPLYFVIDRRGPLPHIHLGTTTPTLAARNVDANPVVQLLLEIERDATDRRLLRVDGIAAVRTEPALVKRYRRGVTRKYIVTPAGLWNMVVHPRQWAPARRHVQGGEGCVIDVTPTGAELLTSPP